MLPYNQRYSVGHQQLTTLLEHGIQNSQSGVHLHWFSSSSHWYLKNTSRRKTSRRLGGWEGEEDEGEGKEREEEEEMIRAPGKFRFFSSVCGKQKLDPSMRSFLSRLPVTFCNVLYTYSKLANQVNYALQAVHYCAAVHTSLRLNWLAYCQSLTTVSVPVTTAWKSAAERHHSDHTIALWHSWPGRQRPNHSCHFCRQNSPPNH